MAFDPANLALIRSVNGFGQYRYDTTDALTSVDGSGYFDNEDDGLALRVGDIIQVVVWGTAVRTGTISGYGQVIVNSVSSGTTDTTSDLFGISIADSD
jgi:hypothetical protein